MGKVNSAQSLLQPSAVLGYWPMNQNILENSDNMSMTSAKPFTIIFNPHSPIHRSYVFVRLTDGDARVFTAIPLFCLLEQVTCFQGYSMPLVE